MRPFPKLRPSRRCSARFPFAVISPSLSRTSLRVALDWSGLHSLPKEDLHMGKTKILIYIALGLELLVAGCSINVKKEKNGEEKQVDINTPVGGIHVSKAADPEDIGIPLYPGARLRQKDSGDDKSANVNISGFGFGLK